MVAAAAGAAGTTAPRPQALPPHMFEGLLAQARPCRLKQGEAAFMQGSSPGAFYLLSQGRCEVEAAAAGETRVVAELRAGDHFGESALLEQRAQRNSTVRCTAARGCELGVLSARAFEEALRTRPALADILHEVALQRTRGRLRTVVQMAAERSDCESRELRAGELIYREGDAASEFWYVHSGSVQLSVRAADGRLFPKRLLRKGDVFGASGLLVGETASASTSDGRQRDTAVAQEASVLKAVPHARFVGGLLSPGSVVGDGIRRVSTNSTAKATVVAQASADRGGGQAPQ